MLIEALRVGGSWTPCLRRHPAAWGLSACRLWMVMVCADSLWWVLVLHALDTPEQEYLCWVARCSTAVELASLLPENSMARVRHAHCNVVHLVRDVYEDYR
jgi:hypothetical protein